MVALSLLALKVTWAPPSLSHPHWPISKCWHLPEIIYPKSACSSFFLAMTESNPHHHLPGLVQKPPPWSHNSCPCPLQSVPLTAAGGRLWVPGSGQNLRTKPVTPSAHKALPNLPCHLPTCPHHPFLFSATPPWPYSPPYAVSQIMSGRYIPVLLFTQPKILTWLRLIPLPWPLDLILKPALWSLLKLPVPLFCSTFYFFQRTFHLLLLY